MTLPAEEFGRLLADARSGQERAITALYDRFQPALLRYLRSQEARVAEDLAAETWLAVAEGLTRFEGDESGFRAWVFSIARRRLVDHRRRAVRRRTEPVAPTAFAQKAADDDPADMVMDQMSAQEAINKLTSLLPGDQAEVLVLRVVGGLSVEEVARILDKRPGSIRALQHRALEKLSSQLTRHFLLEA